MIPAATPRYVVQVAVSGKTRDSDILRPGPIEFDPAMI
jgi:hypothetical protein